MLYNLPYEKYNVVNLFVELRGFLRDSQWQNVGECLSNNHQSNMFLGNNSSRFWLKSDCSSLNINIKSLLRLLLFLEIL